MTDLERRVAGATSRRRSRSSSTRTGTGCPTIARRSRSYSTSVERARDRELAFLRQLKQQHLISKKQRRWLHQSCARHTQRRKSTRACNGESPLAMSGKPEGKFREVRDHTSR